MARQLSDVESKNLTTSEGELKTPSPSLAGKEGIKLRQVVTMPHTQ